MNKGSSDEDAPNKDDSNKDSPKGKNSEESTITELNEEQKQAITGNILGDAYIERVKPTHNPRIRIEQTTKKASYVDHLYKVYEPLCNSPPKEVKRKPDKRTGKTYNSVSFRTRNLPVLADIYNSWYKDRVKVVPANIVSLLTPKALAYWIIDDGGKEYWGSTRLFTNCFILAEVKQVQEALSLNFKLRTRLLELKTNQWAIVIPVRQPVRLAEIVGPYIHESMRYKVHGL